MFAFLSLLLNGHHFTACGVTYAAAAFLPPLASPYTLNDLCLFAVGCSGTVLFMVGSSSRIVVRCLCIFLVIQLVALLGMFSIVLANARVEIMNTFMR